MDSLPREDVSPTYDPVDENSGTVSDVTSVNAPSTPLESPSGDGTGQKSSKSGPPLLFRAPSGEYMEVVAADDSGYDVEDDENADAPAEGVSVEKFVEAYTPYDVCEELPDKVHDGYGVYAPARPVALDQKDSDSKDPTSYHGLGDLDAVGGPSVQQSVHLLPPTTVSGRALAARPDVQTLREEIKDVQDTDWNGRFQDCFDRVCVTPYDEKRRAQEVQKIRDEFVSVAGRIARIIVEQQFLPKGAELVIPPIKGPQGLAGGEKYRCGHVFFKFARDWRGIYSGDKKRKNDTLAQKAARLELQGMAGVVSVGIQTIHVPLMALFSIRGHVVIAQAQAPIKDGRLAVGSDDAGLTINNSDRNIQKLSKELGHKLHLNLHSVVEMKTKTLKEVATAVDVEFHVGTDSRIYILDLARLFPPTPTRGTQYLYHHFRPEAMQYLHSIGVGSLNADAFSRFAFPPHAGVAEIREAYGSLLQLKVPEVAKEMDDAEAPIINGPTKELSELFHSHGLNMRMVAFVAAASKTERTRRTLLEEEVIRALKRYVRALWRGCLNDTAARQVAIEVSVQWRNGDTALRDVVAQSVSLESLRFFENPSDAALQRLWYALGWTQIPAVEDALVNVESMPLPPMQVQPVKTPEFVPFQQQETYFLAELHLRRTRKEPYFTVLLQLVRLLQQHSTEQPQAAKERGLTYVQELRECTMTQEERVQVLDTVWHFYDAVGEHRKALQAAEELRELTRAMDDKNVRRIADATRLAGGTSSVLNNMVQAQAYLEEARDLLLNDGDSREAGMIYRSLSRLYDKLCICDEEEKCTCGKLSEAFEAATTSVEMFRRLGQASKSDEARAMLQLARVLKKQQHFAEAWKLLNDALEMRVQLFGPSHPDVVTMWDTMAMTYESENKLEEAEAWYKKCLEEQINFHGERHPRVAVSYHKLGVVLRKRQQWEEASAMLVKAKNIKEIPAFYGPEHRETRFTYLELSRVYEALSQLYKAKVEDIQKKVRDPVLLRQISKPE